MNIMVSHFILLILWNQIHKCRNAHTSAFQTANVGRGGDQCGTGPEGTNSWKNVPYTIQRI